MDRYEFSVDVNEPTSRKFHTFWNVANWNRPSHLLVPNEIERLKERLPYVDSLNCVYLLGGRRPGDNCWYKGENADGTAIADFTGMIDQIRACLDYGYTPWLVLDNVPYGMSDTDAENFYGNTEPPKSFKLWHSYVKAAIEALVAAFGAEKVSQWFFRVGTEPDLLPGHWSGTKQQYFDHYDYTVDAVLSVLPDAKIGPGNILNPVEGEYGTIVEDQWGLDIIDHAARGTNACTGKTGTVMRWFSCSWYGRVGVPVSMFDKAIEMIRERLGKYPELADLHIDIGEFTVLHDENGVRLFNGDTTEWSASFYSAIAERVYHYGVSKVYEWHHGTEGVLHPKGHVIWMLRQMAGCDKLTVSPLPEPDRDFGVMSARCDNGDILLLAYNHCSERDDKYPRTLELNIAGLDQTRTWKMDQWLVDHDNTVWAYEFEADCQAAGAKPAEKAGRYEGGIEYIYGDRGFEIFEQNRSKYEKLSRLPQISSDEPVCVDRAGIEITLDMPSHSVRFIRLKCN